MSGKVKQINVKPQIEGERGLPKLPVPSALVTPLGLEGDFNKWRQEKDGNNPNAAVLVLPCETIEQLNREGWPVKPGDLGENFLTEGMEYSAFKVGNRYRIGKAVEIKISKACEPCKNLYLLPYVGEEKGPLFLRTMRGRRGWYAYVLREGSVRVGDLIESECGIFLNAECGMRSAE